MAEEQMRAMVSQTGKEKILGKIMEARAEIDNKLALERAAEDLEIKSRRAIWQRRDFLSSFSELAEKQFGVRLDFHNGSENLNSFIQRFSDEELRELIKDFLRKTEELEKRAFWRRRLAWYPYLLLSWPSLASLLAWLGLSLFESAFFSVLLSVFGALLVVAIVESPVMLLSQFLEFRKQHGELTKGGQDTVSLLRNADRVLLDWKNLK